MSLPHTWALSPDPQAASSTRRHLREAWGDLPPSLLDTAMLVASELVTNAVRYGGGDVVVRLWPGAEVVRIEVTDRDPRAPQVRRPSDEEEGGRGLLVVDAVASR